MAACDWNARVLLLGLSFVLGVGSSHAGDAITDPTHQETWHYGSGSNAQSITFTFTTPPDVSSITIKIVDASDEDNEFHSHVYIAPVSSPVGHNLTVPDTGYAKRWCYVVVTVVPFDMSGPRVTKRIIRILKP